MRNNVGIETRGRESKFGGVNSFSDIGELWIL
jgi:hypothetical protein